MRAWRTDTAIHAAEDARNIRLLPLVVRYHSHAFLTR
jgi:hypothetical protein